MKYITTIDGREFAIEVLDSGHIRVDGKLYEVNFDNVGGQPVYSLILDHASYEAYVYPADNTWQVLLFGRQYTALVEDEYEKRLRESLESEIVSHKEFHLKAPMPGLVVAIPVGEGQQVKRGDVLLVLESMKMQNELKAPHAGRVSRLRVKVGDSVEQKQTLMSVV